MRGAARRASGQLPRIILDSAAKSNFLQHLDVYKRQFHPNTPIYHFGQNRFKIYDAD